ncbi:MAG TPA: alpha/beta fold hydrolase [Vicinamibacterales bacterium]
MQAKRIAAAITVLTIVITMAAAIARSQLPAIGAGALLYPARQVSMRAAPPGCIEKTFEGVDVRLAGWVCRSADLSPKPAIVYLHGIGDNRDTSTGVIDRFLRRGFDVVVYDSRGHGRSEGEGCTYGFFEKQDLRRVLVQAGIDRTIVIGHSLGAAVALQAAAIDPRIVGVVAVSTFADLRSIATERAPFVFTPALIDAAFARAERDARFVVDDASPLKAAPKISAPVFIIHGALDEGTRTAHSERVYAALRQPKQLLIVPDAGHNDVLRSSEVWRQIEDWIDTLI